MSAELAATLLLALLAQDPGLSRPAPATQAAPTTQAATSATGPSATAHLGFTVLPNGFAFRLVPIAGADKLALVLSDDFDDGAVTLMERLSAARRDVLNIQLLTVGERDFPFRGGHRFRDPETGAELGGAGAASREGFLRRFAAARRELDARLAAAGVRRVEHVLDEPLDRPLHRLFAPIAADRA